MKAFEFITNVKESNNNQVNLISKCNKGYYITTLNGRMEINETINNNYKYYYSLDEAKQSDQLKKYASFPTYYIKLEGTNYDNAELICVNQHIQIRNEINKRGGLMSFSSYLRKNKPVGCPSKNNIYNDLQNLNKQELHIAFHLGLIGNNKIKGSIIENALI